MQGFQEGPIPASEFGKDHWSLLAYVESRCVNHAGALDRSQMRCNPERRPLLASRHHVSRGWNPSWGTRLRRHFDKKDPSRQIPWHDDWDVLDDLEAAGLVEVVSTVNGWVRLTDLGIRVAAALRAFKASGGHFAHFDLPEALRHEVERRSNHP